MCEYDIPVSKWLVRLYYLACAVCVLAVVVAAVLGGPA